MVMTYSYAKVQGQRSAGSKERVETNGLTNGQTDRRRQLHTSLTNLVGNYYVEMMGHPNVVVTHSP